MHPSSLIPGKPVYNSTDAIPTIGNQGTVRKMHDEDFFAALGRTIRQAASGAVSLFSFSDPLRLGERPFSPLPGVAGYGRMPPASPPLLVPAA
jgi:hypothetical protein